MSVTRPYVSNEGKLPDQIDNGEVADQGWTDTGMPRKRWLPGPPKQSILGYGSVYHRHQLPLTRQRDFESAAIEGVVPEPALRITFVVRRATGMTSITLRVLAGN